MGKRKYVYYSVAFDNKDPETFPSYMEASIAYYKAEGSATMYGVNEQGEVSTIMAK